MYLCISFDIRDKFDVTIGQCCILELVLLFSAKAEFDFWCVASYEKIAEILKMDRSTIIRSVARLEEKGLVVRRRSNPSDTAMRCTDLFIDAKQYYKTNSDAPIVHTSPSSKTPPTQWQNATPTSGKMPPNNKSYNKNYNKYSNFSKKEDRGSYKKCSWSHGSTSSPTPPPRSQPVPATPPELQKIIEAKQLTKNPRAWYHDCKEWCIEVEQLINKIPETKGVIGGSRTPTVTNIKLEFGGPSVISNYARMILKKEDIVAAARKFTAEYVNENKDTPGNLQNKITCNIGSLIVHLPDRFKEQYEVAKRSSNFTN